MLEWGREWEGDPGLLWGNTETGLIKDVAKSISPLWGGGGRGGRLLAL